jgi:predicted transcriptional regulator
MTSKATSKATKLADIGPLELKVLGILNGEAQISVAEIQASLKQTGHDLAYTTVMTVLVRLYNKELVGRHKEGRQFLYSLAKRKESSPLKIFERMKTSLFGNEKLRPILGLLEADDGLSREELEELKKAVEARLSRKRPKA